MNSSYTVIFFSLIIVTSVMSIIYFTNFNTFFSHWKTHLYDKEENKFVISSPVLYNSSMKYILMWTLNTTVPFVYLKSGNEIFVSEECEYQNCYITNNRKYFSDIKKFDALIFHAPEYTWINNHRHLGFPSERGYHQKYVFTCFESSDNYPACDRKFNNYFNWTWTYRTDGDVKWGYIDIKDMNDNIVGPKPNMQWIKNMTDISSEQKEMLKSKTKAAAWFVSNCYTSSRREKFASELHKSLIIRGFTLDIYGKCGKLSCPRDDESKCFELLKKDYFFYLSFENSFCEDYVTEKLIHALKNWVIPVVWGGADYTR